MVYFTEGVLSRGVTSVGREDSRGAGLRRAGQGWIWRLVPCRGGAKVTPADQYRRRSGASIAFEPPSGSRISSRNQMSFGPDRL